MTVMSKHVSIYDIYFWNLDIKGFGGGGVNRTVERISESSCKIAYQRCASTLVAVFIRDSKSFYISLKLLDVVKETRCLNQKSLSKVYCGMLGLFNFCHIGLLFFEKSGVFIKI